MEEISWFGITSHLHGIYWESKARNVEKYTPKKYKKTGTDAEE